MRSKEIYVQSMMMKIITDLIELLLCKMILLKKVNQKKMGDISHLFDDHV